MTEPGVAPESIADEPPRREPNDDIEPLPQELEDKLDQVNAGVADTVAGGSAAGAGGASGARMPGEDEGPSVGAEQKQEDPGEMMGGGSE